MYQNMNYKRFIRYNTGRGSRAGKESRESNRGDGSGGPSDTFPNFCQVLIMGPATLLLCHSDQQQKLRQCPNSRIWTCKSRVIRIQSNEYIRIPSGVRKSKYTCTGNKWHYVKTCLCLHEIMFKSYQWKHM